MYKDTNKIIVSESNNYSLKNAPEGYTDKLFTNENNGIIETGFWIEVEMINGSIEIITTDTNIKTMKLLM